MTSLYQLSAEFKSAAEKLSELDLDEQTMLDTLEGMTGELETKAVNVACFFRNLEASATAIKDAEKQMKERREAIERKVERLKKYLLDNMLQTGITKIECPLFKLSVRDNPAAVEVFDQALVPEEYLRKTVAAEIDFNSFEITHENEMGIDWITITGPREAFKFTEAPDKANIKEAIKQSIDVPGCRLTAGKRLEVK